MMASWCGSSKPARDPQTSTIPIAAQISGSQSQEPLRKCGVRSTCHSMKLPNPKGIFRMKKFQQVDEDHGLIDDAGTTDDEPRKIWVVPYL